MDTAAFAAIFLIAVTSLFYIKKRKDSKNNEK